MADPAHRLAALAQAPAEVAPRVERPGRDMDRARGRDKARLRAGQVDTPAHTLGAADRARMADRADRADRATEVWRRRLRHLEPLRYRADMDHTVTGQEAALMPEQPAVTAALIVPTAVEERPVPLAAWVASAKSPAPLEPDCPAVQNGGSVAPRRPDNLDHPDAWWSRNAGRLFHPRR